jgi:hypothetical protein
LASHWMARMAHRKLSINAYGSSLGYIPSSSNSGFVVTAAVRVERAVAHVTLTRELWQPRLMLCTIPACEALFSQTIHSGRHHSYPFDRLPYSRRRILSIPRCLICLHWPDLRQACTYQPPEPPSTSVPIPPKIRQVLSRLWPVWKCDSTFSSPSRLGPVARVNQTQAHNTSSFCFIVLFHPMHTF